MTARSFFIIVIKIIGLFFLKHIIETIPQFISTVLIISGSDSPKDASYIFMGASVVLAIYIFVCFILLGRANKIVDLLRLDQGFVQDSFTCNMSETSILTAAIIIIGGLLLANEIPGLCRSLYLYVTQRNLLKYTEEKPDLSYSILIAAKIILGLLLIGERKRIVNFIAKKDNKPID